MNGGLSVMKGDQFGKDCCARAAPVRCRRDNTQFTIVAPQVPWARAAISTPPWPNISLQRAHPIRATAHRWMYGHSEGKHSCITARSIATIPIRQTVKHNSGERAAVCIERQPR